MSDQDDSNIERDDAHDDDDDYDFAEDNNRGRNQAKGDGEKAQVIQNQHFDEAVEVSEAGSDVQSDPDPEQEEEEEEEPEKPSPPKKPVGKIERIQPSADSEPDEDRDEKQIAGAYDPSNYSDLPASQEVKDLFKYITRFRPTTVELDTKFKAFIPDYIPAIGEVDAFLKPSKPNNQPENLGLLTIDEPCLNQSKESTMRIILDRYAKKPGGGPVKKVVHSIEQADKNPKEITRWIQDVSSIQRQPPSVGYSKPFPDIDTLMQVWPVEIEDAFQNLRLPTEDLDLNLEEYVRLGCALTDIPVHNTTTGKNLIESLHVFFTLYAEFKANQHFQQQNEQYVYE